MARRRLSSVGIDIGTTTTQVIFSELELINRAGVSQVPRYEFSRRDIVHVSPVAFTPIDANGRLHEDKLLAFILAQFEAAGRQPGDVESGAIIITGETSKARNARGAIMRLAESLGDFVVATAGPHLESVIAGHGSGASDLSLREVRRVVNIDIGGGTANYAVFEGGRLVDTACLNVGGRLIETDPRGHVTRVHGPAQRICAEVLGSAFDAMQMDQMAMQRVTTRMAELLYEVLQGKPSPLARQLLMTAPLRPESFSRVSAITMSGGVGECFYRGDTATPFAFGDIGPMLAQAIHAHAGMQALPWREPCQTVRATVIGAGAYTLSLSGSTIWLDQVSLPIRNVPVVQPRMTWADHHPHALVDDWTMGLTQMDLDPTRDPFALCLPADVPVAYQAIEYCVQELAEFARRHARRGWPLLVLARQDLGKVLGMLLRPLLGDLALAVIDEVATRDGDYIDIGTPLFGGEIVPVTVKSLAFPSSNGGDLS